MYEACRECCQRYARLSGAEREEISRGLAQRLGFREMARRLNRSVSTISREVAKTQGDPQDYRSTQAQLGAMSRRCRRQRRLDTHPQLRARVMADLRQCWSPEQIAFRLKRDYPGDPAMHLSHEAIYTYLYVLPRGRLRTELLACLRQPRPYRRPRSRHPDRRGQITDMLSIEQRPAAVADRCIPGHWEGDLIVGKHCRTAVGTLVERSSRYLLLALPESKRASDVRQAFADKIKTLPQQLRASLTYDQGKEMAEHRLFTQDTRMIVYFAHPHSPWERGTNENTNGLIRQFFPKGTDFSQVSTREIKRVQDLLNNRPRKTLNWQTPNEVMAEFINRVALGT